MKLAAVLMCIIVQMRRLLGWLSRDGLQGDVLGMFICETLSDSLWDTWACCFAAVANLEFCKYAGY